MSEATDTRHPAPHRDRVSTAAMAFAVAGAPLAWVIHQIVNYALAAHPCFPDDEARLSALPGWGAARLGLVGVDVLAIVIAVAATWIAWRSFRAVRHEHPGSHEALLEKGEGRTRFLALCGVLGGLGFLAAIVFDTLSTLMAPLCAA